MAKETDSSRPRLVGFLGTRNYENATYALGDSSETGRFTPAVLARLLGCAKVDILATAQALEMNQESLTETLDADGIASAFHEIPAGRDETELRQQFRRLRDLLIIEPERPLVLDITLGFRAQSIFAAAGLAAIAAAGRLPNDTRIFYGAFDAKEGNTVPIWDLTPLLHMISFAQAAATFRATGDGRPLADALENERRHIAKRAQAGERKYARASLISPLRMFAEDFAACRVPALLVGTDSPDGRRTGASARRLLEALEEWGNECDTDFPALVPMLDQLVGQVKPLAVKEGPAAEHGLAAAEARHAVAALARLYLDSGRMLEALAVTREEIVSRLADTPEAIAAARPEFDRDLRKEAERIASRASHIRGIFDFRNDLLHAGMRDSPSPGRVIARNVSRCVREIARPPKTVVVTRHEGAVEWLKRQNIHPDEICSHLTRADIDNLIVGDRVIGSLPPELLSSLCQRGVRCDLIVLNVPEEQRGQELDADQLEAAGACLKRAFLELE